MKAASIILLFTSLFHLTYAQNDSIVYSNQKKNITNLGIKIYNTNGNGSGFGFQFERRLSRTSFISFVIPIDFSLNLRKEGVFGKISGMNINPGVRFNLGENVSNYFYAGSSLLLGSNNSVIKGLDLNRVIQVDVSLNRFQIIPYLNIGLKGHFSSRVSFNLEAGLGYRISDNTSFDVNPNIIINEFDLPRDIKYAPSLFFGLGYNF